tara:strand:+ start:1330 stop:1638 length:309 start_codon:yes stop_codon:yes gene_type:complete
MKQFKDYLDSIEYPKSKTTWHIAGVIKGKNGFYKFDTAPLKNNAKAGSFKTKADKIVYDLEDQYIIVDTSELHQYLKDKKLKKVVLEELISALEWNIILPKN